MFPDNDKKDKHNVAVSNDNNHKNKQTASETPDANNIDSTVDLTNLKGVGANSGNQDLLNIKHKALKEVSNLIDNLEQPPEQLFRTLMMIIQETDNSNMLERAYNTAIQIEDEKSRAEALLTIANEINYFTSK